MSKKLKTEELSPQPMIADRKNIKEAFDYGINIMERGSPEMKTYGLVALGVIWNTLANKYKLIKNK